ncbi:hypothetical protein F5882DRAFT_385624 [Hyaloscypha sp. PMI_1271]|nr:hypothetical protein F5882DRAFT_385624 [Hyaloscypha sp. PMI_1271]
MNSVLRTLSTLLLLFCVPLISARLAFYPLFSEPNATITRFETTVSIPANSPDRQTPDNDFQGFWPGLETKEADFVLQNVIWNWNPTLTPGEWSLHPMYCCRPMGGTDNVFRLYPGDQVKSVFAIDNLTGKWHDGWSVARGQQGHVAKQVPFSGNMTFDPSIATVPDRVPYTMAVLTIELQEEATWDFGSVTFTDITIEATTTTNTLWCTEYAPEDSS